MIRTAARKAMFVAAATLMTGVVAVNCSNKGKDAASDVGSVGLAVHLSSGVDLTSVTYSVSGNGITPITGTINVTDPAGTVTVLVNGIPAGNNYLVTLTGTATDMKTVCGGQASFNVIASQTTPVTVILQCRAPKTTGSVGVTGQVDNCPAITGYMAAPLATSVGGSISVGASASDLDVGDTVTFAWTATTGTFANAALANTSFTCTGAGPATLTLTVSDGKCTDIATIPVTCAGTPVCGNGVKEAGEQCDPPNGTTCSATCQSIAGTGGAGTGGAGTGGAGTGGAGTGGAGTGGTVGTGGSSTGGTVGTGGAGTGGAGTGGMTGSGGSNVACTNCETAQCDPSFQGCSSLTGSDRTLCDALVLCIKNTHCSKNGDAQACWCGTATDVGCLSGMANGPCKAEEEAAAKTGVSPADPGAVAERFVDPGFPIGLGNNLIGCDHDSCSMQCPL